MFGLSRLDKFFAFIEKHWVSFALGGSLALLVSWAFQRELIAWVQPLRPFFETLAIIFGVPVTAGGFYLGYRSKRDMVTIHQASVARLEEYSKTLAEQTAKSAALQEKVATREEELSRAAAASEQQREELKAKGDRVALLEANLKKVAESGHELWSAHPPTPFPEYEAWRDAANGAKVITIGNLKGGVGKTTIAANLAAYVAERITNKPVLVIDLDYQGSLSNMMMFASDKIEVPSHTERLLAPNATLSTLLDAKISLNPKLPNAVLVPASYSLANAESSHLLRWLMEPSASLDARYRLARVLLDPIVRREFSMIILDMPPRMTLAGVNALVASHALVVPALLDRMSVEAVQQFLAMVKTIKHDSNLAIDLLGIVASLTMQNGINEREEASWNALGTDAGRAWGDKEYRFEQVIPRRVAISTAAGGDIAYVADDGRDKASAREVFAPLFDELWDRLYPKFVARLDEASSTETQ